MLEQHKVLIQQCALDAFFFKWMAGRQQLVSTSKVWVLHNCVSYIHNCQGNHCQLRGKCCHLSSTNETSQKLQVIKWMDSLQVHMYSVSVIDLEHRNVP